MFRRLICWLRGHDPAFSGTAGFHEVGRVMTIRCRRCQLAVTPPNEKCACDTEFGIARCEMYGCGAPVCGNHIRKIARHVICPRCFARTVPPGVREG
jgi:hypothetical protein